MTNHKTFIAMTVLLFSVLSAAFAKKDKTVFNKKTGCYVNWRLWKTWYSEREFDELAESMSSFDSWSSVKGKKW